jgi:hypothetical protein
LKQSTEAVVLQSSPAAVLLSAAVVVLLKSEVELVIVFVLLTRLGEVILVLQKKH